LISLRDFFAEVAVFEHFGFCLHGELPDAGDVGVVEAVGGADGEFDLVDAHVEELAELAVFLGLRFRGGFEFDEAVVVIDEDVEVLAEDGAGLGEGRVRGDAAIGPEFEDEFVVVGFLADPAIFDPVADAGDRGEDGVHGDHADGHVRAFIVFAAGEAATDADFHFEFEFDLTVEGADNEVLIEDTVVLVLADVTGGDDPVAIDADAEEARFFEFGVGEADLFEVEDDVGDIFDDAWEATEFVLGAFDFDAGDGCAFEAAEEDAAEAVSDGVAVAAFEWFGDVFGVGVGGSGLLFGEAAGHFKPG